MPAMSSSAMAILCSRQIGSNVRSMSRSSALNRSWMASTGPTARYALRSSGVPLLTPTARIFPCCFNSISVDIVSSTGVVGSCQWVM